MAVKEKSVEPEAPGAAPDINPLDEPGFHVLGNGTYCGTFIDREQAEAYIEGQLLPQEGMKAEVVEGPAATE